LWQFRAGTLRARCGQVTKSLARISHQLSLHGGVDRRRYKTRSVLFLDIFDSTSRNKTERSAANTSGSDAAVESWREIRELNA
jgi:hypothetical protein